MKQDQINSLLDSFFISSEDLNSRNVFKEFANSLSEIVIDDFVKNYLLNNPHLSIYLAHTDGSMLVKKIKEFVVFILTAEVDEEYINRIHFIGSIHYSIKLEPAKVSYGFWAIDQILNKMGQVNEIVRDNGILISKLFRFVEHLMNDGYYIQQEKQKRNYTGQDEGISIQNELYVGLNIHKLNMNKVSKAIENEEISILEDIEESSQLCLFGKVLEILKSNSKYQFVLGFDADEINNTHIKWHDEFVLLKQAFTVNDKEQVLLHYENLQGLTKKLKQILDITLKNSLEDGQLSLNSGMKAMRNMTELFYQKGVTKEEKSNSETSIARIILETVLYELQWAIDDVVVQYEKISEETFSIVKQIRYKTKNIFIGVKLKENNSSAYVIEMINLLLEVFDLHLSVKDRESSLIDFADKAEHANKAKDMFLANMSHELRTPLNAITGFSQILMMKKDTPDSVKKYVEKINIAGTNLLELVNTILDFAKLEAGKMQFQPSLSNISNVLTEVRTLVEPLARKKSITLKMPNIISLNLFIDQTLFKQVLINLLSNAIKFTHEEGDVSLSIEYNADLHRYIFEVKDNGIGLSTEAMSKLFEAFSQVENTYQKEHKGTGLGLMISKKIIEDLHKGNIWVESKEGKGSSFFLSMPTPMIESHTYSVNKLSDDAPNILIVEDSENYQKLLIEHLKETHNMTITDTINKAKDLLSTHEYSFIILDFFLTDGISSEILQFMEEEKISTPTIIISAEDEIHISTSLAGFSNLECIMNKKDVEQICASLRGESYS